MKFNSKFGILIKKIFIILGLFVFVQNSFAEKNELDEINKFAKTFYSDVYNNSDTSKKSSSRLSKETGLSQNAIENLANGIDQNFEEIANYCKINFNGNLGTCTENLIKRYKNEESILKTENQFGEETYANEIWADGNTQNSFFDLIYDLNIIDIILFGEDATIFFYKYDGNPDNDTHSLGVFLSNSTGGTNNYDLVRDYIINEGNTGTTNQNGQIPTWINPNTGGTQTPEQTQFWTNTEVTNSYNFVSKSCIDPFRFSFNINIRGGFTGYSLTNALITNTNDTGHYLSGSDNLDITQELFSNITNLNNEDLDIIYIGNDGYIQFRDDNKDSKIECKKPLYGGLLCLDQMRDGWECFPENTEIFCIEIRRKYQNQEVLGTPSGKGFSCINCLVKKMNNIINTELMGRVLNPRENSNKNGNLPNWIGMFGIPSKLIDVTYLPIPWLNEKDPEKVEKPRIEKERKIEKYITKPITNCPDRSINEGSYVRNAINNLNDCEQTTEQVDEFTSEYTSKTNLISSKKKYFEDVYGRFKEFRNIFESGIEENIKRMPINDWSKIKKCSQIKNN